MKNLPVNEGDVFGSLTVLGPTAKGGELTWRVLCLCGLQATASGYDLSKGIKTHCGCQTCQVPAPVPLTPTSSKDPDPGLGQAGGETDYTQNWRAWRKMVMAIAELIPRDLIPIEDAERAGGGVICPTCRLPYDRHPEAGGMPTFHLLCSGDVVKT